MYHISYVIMPQIAKFMGLTWGPSGSCRPQMGPMLAPWTLLSGIPSIIHNVTFPHPIPYHFMPHLILWHRISCYNMTRYCCATMQQLKILGVNAACLVLNPSPQKWANLLTGCQPKYEAGKIQTTRKIQLHMSVYTYDIMSAPLQCRYESRHMGTSIFYAYHAV